MSRDNSYLLTAEPSVVAESVKTYGMITFYGNGLTESQNAAIAARTIGKLWQELVGIRTILLSNKRRDDSYQSVTFEVGHTVGTMASIRRRVKFIDIANLPMRDDLVEEGPLVPASKAQAICDILNIEEPE